jgi:hypothetical protein
VICCLGLPPYHGAITNWLHGRPHESAVWHSPLHLSTSESGQWPGEGLLQSPGQFHGIPERKSSMAVLPTWTRGVT